MSAADAARILGVKRETLYAYASRGLVRNTGAADGSRSRVYHRDDLERLRARSQARAGHGAVAAGALRWGEPVLETRVGTIRADGPAYRGRSAVELAKEGARFEDVCALLWQGPFAPEGEIVARRFGVPVEPLRRLLPKSAEPFDAMLLAVAALAAAEPRGETVEGARLRAASLVRRLVAACALSRGGDAVEASLDAGSTAQALLVALGAKPTAARVAAMKEALVLCADHELNPSTFSARVAASAGASLVACVLAAYAALSGTLHGAATARVEAFVAEVERPERAAAAVAARVGRGESIPGFGHPLYPQGDPRGERLFAVATKLAERNKTVRILNAVSSTMDLVARERPTLDVGLVALAGALGLPKGAPLAIFASGRLAGCIAHALEQREAGYILRPRALYVGE